MCHPLSSLLTYQQRKNDVMARVRDSIKTFLTSTRKDVHVVGEENRIQKTFSSFLVFMIPFRRRENVFQSKGKTEISNNNTPPGVERGERPHTEASLTPEEELLCLATTPIKSKYVRVPYQKRKKFLERIFTTTARTILQCIKIGEVACHFHLDKSGGK